MAKGQKAKANTNTKHRSLAITKTTSKKKTKAPQKKPTKKALVRRTSDKKGRATAEKAANTTPAASSAQPAASAPSLPALPTPSGECIGIVTHYYSYASVATLRLDSGILHIGDVIHFYGHTTDFIQRVESLEINHQPVAEVSPGDDFGLKVNGHVREHDLVYKLRPHRSD